MTQQARCSSKSNMLTWHPGAPRFTFRATWSNGLILEPIRKGHSNERESAFNRALRLVD